MSQQSEPNSNGIDASAVVTNILRGIWSSLGETEQDAAFRAFWVSKDDSIQSSRKRLTSAMADTLRCRKIMIERSALDKQVRLLGKVYLRKDFFRFFEDYVRAWLIEERGPMLGAFLDGASVPHVNGYAKDDRPPTAEQFEKGIRSLEGVFSPRDAAIYLCYLGIFAKNGDYWNALREAPSFESKIAQFIVGKTSTKPQAAPEPEPETNEQVKGATVLDDWLIRLAVSTAFGEEGAPDEDTLEHIVEEFVELNASRHRSLFHRGFFHALFGRDFEFSFPGENAARRQWYACGVVFGLMRANRTDEAVALLVDTASGVGHELAGSHATPCGAKLLPLLVRPLLAGEHLDFVSRYAANQLGHVTTVAARHGVCEAIYQHATRLLRHGMFPKSEKLVDLLMGLSEDESNGLGPEFTESHGKLVLRRKAQCQQAKGAFSKARATLDSISGNGDDLPPNAIADRGLIEGAFRKLSAILPRPSPGENKGLVEALAKGREYFVKAVDLYEDKATNAHFCLGVFQTLDGSQMESAQERADHLQQALGGMLEDSQAYSVEGFQKWTEGLLALALLETAEHSNYPAAAELVSSLLDSDIRFPTFLWERMFNAATLFDDKSLSLRIASHLVETGEDTLDCLLKSAKILAAKDEILDTVLEKALLRKSSVNKEWNQLTSLLPNCLQFGANGSAGTILDRLESLAMRDHPCRLRLVDLLSDSDNYSPAWDSADADDLRARLLEIEGRPPEAAEILRARFHQLKTGVAPYELFEARCVLDSIRALGATGVDVDGLESTLPSQNAEQQISEQISCHVLYVGGDETQEQYKGRLLREIAAEHPGITVEFSFPGWSSNWNVALAKLKPAIKRADVVVINPLVRTQLGRHLRATCDADHPWLPCTGRGFDALKRSIINSARWVTQLHSRCS